METLLGLREIYKRYSTGNEVLQGVSLSVVKGQTLALIGSNGSGKTTLIRILAELSPPTGGKIEYPSEKKPRIGYVPERFPQNIRFSIYEYLLNMGLIAGMQRDVLQRRIRALLGEFDLANSSKTAIGKLSKGMRQKVAVMQAILQETDLLILDEPLSGLDAKAQLDLTRRLKGLKARGMTMIFTSHELPLLEEIADRVVVLRNGAIAFDDGIEQLGLKSTHICVTNASQDLIEAVKASYAIAYREGKTGYWDLTAEPSCSDAVLLRLLEGGAGIITVEPGRTWQENLAVLLGGGSMPNA